ncbi:MAG: hypothetical protein IJ662_07070 [Clostridia bacterium]|nr:hypothetical protein [Clostridia bacterium]
MKKKEKHPVYALLMACLILILLAGAALLVIGIHMGPGSYLPHGASI